ncbi:MAG TPA: MauE/DoxX family redox-associated membrane protein [Acidimicrobiales bacterium]|nr:MauE/DoxX family redox-associated membrane protein [Acidimicrobiales bacterium]
MSALAGLLHLTALVLVASGAQKVVQPLPAARAMATAGIRLPGRLHPLAGRTLGLGEAATGLAVFAAPHPVSAGWLGIAYVALAGFVVALRRRDADAGCGCFGAASTPPTTAHVVLDLAAAAVALGTAFTGVPDVVDVLDEGAGVAVPYALLVVLGATLVLLAPTLLAAVRPTGRADPVPAFGPRPAGPPGALR